jgi:hypothetical protein
VAVAEEAEEAAEATIVAVHPSAIAALEAVQRRRRAEITPMPTRKPARPWAIAAPEAAPRRPPQPLRAKTRLPVRKLVNVRVRAVVARAAAADNVDVVVAVSARPLRRSRWFGLRNSSKRRKS